MCCLYLASYQFFIAVVPSPKVLESPHNLNTTVGSKAVFTCNFEAATDNITARIHWLFNSIDLTGCDKIMDKIKCTVTQQSIGANRISSILTIYPVQADNAGQYTCYCSYDTSLLNVDGVQVIESENTSATLSVVASGAKPGGKVFIIIGISIGIIHVLIITGLMLFHYYQNKNTNTNHRHSEQVIVGKLHK